MSELEQAARHYLHACQAVDGADGPGLMAAITDRDIAFPDLVVAAGEPCTQCEPGSCPGSIPETPAL